MNSISLVGGFVVGKVSKKTMLKKTKLVKSKSPRRGNVSSSGRAIDKANFIKKTDTLGEIIEKYPEVAPVLASAGLHCIGCHVSSYESIEQGCLAHGMQPRDIEEMLENANRRIGEYEKMPQMCFSENAIKELSKRLGGKKYLRLVQIFGGEFDFEAVDSKEREESSLLINSGKSRIEVITSPRIERMLRGVKIDYDLKQKDFVASRV